MTKKLKIELEEVKEKIKSLSSLHKDFIVWKSDNNYFIQCYTLNGRKKELYGNVYKVDFENSSFIVSN